jgi:hypothetical protein
MSFTDQIKAALTKKQAAQHPDQKAQDGNKQKQSGAPRTNRPERKAAGRGR